jgi:cation transport ATPase
VALTTDDVRDASGLLWIAQAARREAVRGALLATTAGAILAMLGAFGLLGPGLVALVAGLVDLAVLPSAARLDHRIQLRLPTRG